MVNDPQPSWLAEYRTEQGVGFRIGRLGGDRVVAEWVGLLTLVARTDGSEWQTTIVDGADPRDVEKVSRGGVQLLLRHLAGKVALHGAAVALHGRGVILLGRSGQGKSTLAATLCFSGECQLFADDAVALDRAQDEPRGWQLRALETNHWLDGAARRALGFIATDPGDQKQPLPAREARATPSAQLVAFVDLAFSDVGPPQLRRLEDLEAVGAIIPQAVRFAVDDPVRHRLELDVLGALVEMVPVYRLTRPHGLEPDQLRANADAVLQLLRGTP